MISKFYLDRLVDRYEKPEFITDDPIAIPHGFDAREDQEVIGLYTALLSWGQRKTILNKMAELCERMRFRPHSFVRHFDEQRDGSRLDGFKHRTFSSGDALWLTKNLREALVRFGSLETLFASNLNEQDKDVGAAIQGFSDTVINLVPGTPARLRKHLARPDSGSACKRLTLYLRWMVRPGPVDLGIWTRIGPDQLVLPLDVHSGRQARTLGFLTRKSNDWQAVMELTRNCRRLDPRDPCRYDFAFFGAGIHKETGFPGDTDQPV